MYVNNVHDSYEDLKEVEIQSYIRRTTTQEFHLNGNEENNSTKSNSVEKDKDMMSSKAH